tara:strand:+ start:1294 stop:3339 length:2046 start_codon:yes stop_codon:yes gene_type:complete
METYTVVLPNGVEIENVPIGTSKSVIQDLAISNGYATIEDFRQTPTPVPTPEPPPVSVPDVTRRRGSTVETTGEEGTTISDIGEYIKENMELPLGVGGAVGGAIAGSPFGPVGSFVGSVIGSAVGTGTGSLISDELAGEDLDYAKAMEEALISVGFDIATLGAGKVLKPAYIAAKRKLGFTPLEAAQQLMKEVEPAVGTQASLQATQEILVEGGATLTPSQVGATGVQLIAEKVGRVGIGSASQFDNNVALVNQAAQDGLNDVVNRLSVNSSGTPIDLAENLMSVIDAGKEALITNYGRSLDQLAGKAPANARFGIGKHISAIDRFLAQRTKDGIVDLDPASIKFIEKNLRPMMGNNLASAKSLDALIILDKQMTAQIRRKFGTPGTKSFNPDAERQLTALAKDMREATYNSLKKVNPKLASQYKTMKDAYSEGIQGLLPEINSNFVDQAAKGNYSALGNTLANAGNASQILAFKKSMQEAFKQIEKSGAKTAGQFIAYEEAEALLKKGFLEKLFPELSTEAFNIDKYSNLARRLSSKGEQERFRAVLGSDFPRVKQLINLMAEASTKPSGNIGELAMRSKEYQAGRTVAQTALGIGTAAQVGGGMGMGAGAAIILTPMFLARAALNPAHVNRLIAFHNKEFKDSAAMEAAAYSIMGSVLDAMTDEEQAEFRNAIREGTLQ